MAKRIDLYRSCIQCGTSFKTVPSVVANGGGKYCSNPCKAKHLWSTQSYAEKQKQIHKGHKSNDALVAWQQSGGIPWNKGMRDVVVAWNKGKKMPEISGEHHYLWITDRTKAVEKRRMRSSIEWKQWRMDVFKRDGYKCIDCGDSGYLEPHHIIPLRETLSRAFDINNGITLCRPCHKRTMGKELKLMNTYLSLVQVRV